VTLDSTVHVFKHLLPTLLDKIYKSQPTLIPNLFEGTVFEQLPFETIDKICQKWTRFIRKVKLCKFIENTLKIDYNGRN
jgi:hypothetical protein